MKKIIILMLGALLLTSTNLNAAMHAANDPAYVLFEAIQSGICGHVAL